MKKPDPMSTVTGRDQERRRLARILESRLNGTLNLLLAQANAYRAALSCPTSHARNAIDTLAGMAARALTDLQDLVDELAPTALEDLGFVDALEIMSSRIERQYGLAVTLDVTQNAVGMPSSLALPAYRIVQEALHNAGQHAGARRVGVSLRLEKDTWRLTIADDGDGFHPPMPLEALSAEGKWGLAEMIDRAQAVGGKLKISSVRGVGTQVRAYLPLQPKRKRNWDNAGESPLDELTPREQEVLAGVAEGLTNKQIAARLGISDRTVQFHLGNVLGKFGVASRTEAAVLALQNNLV